LIRTAAKCEHYAQLEIQQYHNDFYSTTSFDFKGSCIPMKIQLSAKGFYHRTLPQADDPLNTAAGEVKLKTLADAMSDTVNADSTNLPTGYTYFGQFIDHDLTWNRTALDASADEHIYARNFRTALLDLDHVYGDGPGSRCSGALYEGDIGEERFCLGKTVASPDFGLEGGTPYDIPFERDVPLIGDQKDLRNAENLIVRQLHVVFLKFHNAVIAELPAHEKEPGLPTGRTLFDRVRLLVIWTYQYLVWNDFLFRVLGTWRHLSDEGTSDKHFALPLEFALAGFRFGHSMVRGAYPLNCHHNLEKTKIVSLRDLINPSDKFAPRLKEEYVLEWGRFFPGIPASDVSINARKIDTHITDVLRDLPIETILLFSRGMRGGEIPSLPQRTLLRGARSLLASGQQVANEWCLPNLAEELGEDEALKDTGLTKNTPLWYFILKEAELTKDGGESLGVIGGKIVQDTIEAALQHDSSSFLRINGEDWVPPTWILPAGRPYISEMIKFAVGKDLPQGCQPAHPDRNAHVRPRNRCNN
jgi:hypothetical protein